MTKPYVPFSQRTGLSTVPPQLKLGEASTELRRLLHYAILKDLEDGTSMGYSERYLDDRWKALARDLWVRFHKRSADTFKADPYSEEQALKNALNAPLGPLFDFVEFLERHANFSDRARREVRRAFEEARAAYRIVDGQIVAIGTEEQAAAFEKAVSATEAKGAAGARKHLVEAGAALRKGEWAASVRESINAVEAMARLLAPSKDKLSEALAVIEKKGHLHGALKAAFSQLYGYASDEKGVRHALVFDDEAKVDEADALFMLGACASFVSYLLARSGLPDAS